MNEFFEKISKQFMSYWGKFSNKQRTTIIVLGVVIIIALSTAVYFATRPNMVVIYDDLTVAESAAIVKVLDENSITYTQQNDGKTLLVEKDNKNKVRNLLVDTKLPSSGYTYEDAYQSSMTDTEKVKQEKLYQAMETEIEQVLKNLADIKEANVILEIPEYDRLYQNNVKDSTASVVLTTNSDLSASQVDSVVGIVMHAVKNLTQENITIVDHLGRTLFGGSVDTESSMVDKKFENKVKQEQKIEKDIRELLASNFNIITPKVNLVLDYDAYESTKESYSNPVGDGSDKGLVQEENQSSSSTTNVQAGGAPGIDSNPGEVTQYQASNQTGTESGSESESTKASYIYDKNVTYESKSPGKIVYNASSIAVNVIQFKEYEEALLEKNGTLNGTTWAEFKETINEQDFVVNDTIIQSVKNATGIDNVTMYGVMKPLFIDKPVSPIPYRQYLLILVVAGLLVLLLYVVYRGTEPVEVTEIIPELSVEELLSKNIEDEVEEIQEDESNGIKKEINRFVDEKPEAAAQLLRNWLSQDWE